MFEIGSSLREARLRQGLDFPELEQATKIRGKYLRALEEEQFHVLPAQTYVKGFLRSYAEELGLDGQLYVDEYNSRYVTGEDEPVVTPRRGPSRPSVHRRFERRGILIGLAIIGALFALVIAAWKFGSSGNEKLVGVNQPPANVSRPSHNVLPATPTHTKRTKAPAVAPVVHVTFKAVHGNCWLDVRRGAANGPRKWSGTVLLGEHYTFTGRRLWIDVGAPAAVTVRLNGKAVSLPGGAGGKPVVVIATAQGLKPATAAA